MREKTEGEMRQMDRMIKDLQKRVQCLQKDHEEAVKIEVRDIDLYSLIRVIAGYIIRQYEPGES